MILAGGNKDERLDLSNNSKLEQTRQAAMVVFKVFVVAVVVAVAVVVVVLVLVDLPRTACF